jgi:hypothetical protein
LVLANSAHSKSLRNPYGSTRISVSYHSRRSTSYWGKKMTGTLFDPDYRSGRHRHPDWTSSIIGAERIAYRSGSQKDKLLNAYRSAFPNGLTDDEAAVVAGLPLTSCYWKRCGELRQDGKIVPGKVRESTHNREMRIECFYKPEEES